MVKLSRRKHMASGSRLTRACICEDYARGSLEPHIPQLLFLVFSALWPAIVARAQAGQLTSPAWCEKRELNELRNKGARRLWRNATDLGTHSLGRGVAGSIAAT